MRVRMLASVGLVLMMAAPMAAQHSHAIPRTPDGKPDLTGFYDANTLTPMERSPQFAGRPLLTDDEAAAIVRAQAATLEEDKKPVDPNRPPPPAGGNLGRGYNDFWKSPSSRLVDIRGEKRTSIIIDPPNGRMPPMTPEGKARDESFGGLAGRNDVIERRGEPRDGFDNPERRVLSERCLTGWGWTAGPPILPNYLYNNMKQIVQTPTHVMILSEMIHEARIVRIGGQHLPPSVRQWSGDSIGKWEGDTLVVDTTNFTNQSRFRGSSDQLHLVERFSRLDADTVLYRFTVEDPSTWAQPWTGEYTWAASTDGLFEYACHEANYAMAGILRGARVIEAEKASQTEPKP